MTPRATSPASPATGATTTARARTTTVAIARASEPSQVAHRLARQPKRLLAGIVDPDQFAEYLAAEHDRREHGGSNCVVGALTFFEMRSIRFRLGHDYVFDLVSEITSVIQPLLAPLDLVHVSESGEILILFREASVTAAVLRLEHVGKAISARRITVRGERLLLTPSSGWATLDDGLDATQVLTHAVDAKEISATHLDLRPQRWTPDMSPTETSAGESAPTDTKRSSRLRLPLQIVATYVVGLVVPFLLYWGFDAVGADITGAMYISVVAALVLTGVMIIVESIASVRQPEPPPIGAPYPKASAIICAYLPNEAGTILDTVDAFLSNGYPGGLQVIVAYNTPTRLPVEDHLHRLAERHSELDVVRVDGSNSKAQNVNAVLHLANGEFTAMFDADHEPRPGSFERAWAWLSNGYDVVQGHCLTRNGSASRLASVVAVEFESIYAVSHPGRARLHGFGVFGGSNGYWRTDLLHETRMRGSMLTEDIDSSLRVVEQGHRIRSDRDIVSRELGTTTVQQLWNQRLRWAQGWFQVTLQHSRRVWQSRHLSMRQKLGMSYLLGWREVYPWLSLQVFPLIAFWLFRGDEFDLHQPVFFLATLFVLHVGPVQTLFAYALADPEIKQQRLWFLRYLVVSTLFYTEFKNTISRVAHIKELMGERSWRVTPRSQDPVALETLDQT